MKIALAQFNPTVGDFAGNTARILSLAAQAQERGAGLAVFTELCLCGYPPQDLLERPAFIERNHKELKKLAAKIPLPAVIGYAGRVKNGTGKSIGNKAALICDGRVVFEQSKMLLPTYDVRRRLERPEFLGAATLRPRSGKRNCAAGNYGVAEYLGVTVHAGQARAAF